MNRVLAISVIGGASVSSPCGDKGMAQSAPDVVTARFASSESPVRIIAVEIVREWSVPHWNLAFCLDLGGLDGTESKRNLFCSMTSDLPTFKNLFPLGDFFHHADA